MATIYEIRRDNLRLLIDQRGNNEVAKATGYSSASYLSQMAGKNPTRTVTENTARKVEEALLLPKGWLDIERDLYGREVTGKSPSPVSVSGDEPHPPAAVLSNEEFQVAATAVSNAMVAAGVKLSKEKFATIVHVILAVPCRTESEAMLLAEKLVSLAC